MNYEKFVKEVKRGVEDIVEKELGEGVVVVRNVLKNNSEFLRRKNSFPNHWLCDGCKCRRDSNCGYRADKMRQISLGMNHRGGSLER